MSRTGCPRQVWEWLLPWLTPDPGLGDDVGRRVLLDRGSRARRVAGQMSGTSKKGKVMAKVNFYEFTVEGSGEFPFDMLRYDGCYPASNVPDNIIRLARLAYASEESFGTRQVTLVGTTAPTLERWRSFGGTVVRARKLDT